MKEKIVIRRYETKDEKLLFTLLENEGEEWQDYWKGNNKLKYKKALSTCINYLLFNNDELCGYVRCRDDDGYGIYVLDLLVDKRQRGKEYGRFLMEQVCIDFPNDIVYVTSGVDPYYEKLGYEKEGTIYQIKIKS
ncbi:MAG: GNAT family N-acetyltransferase [Coprobacillaceae bacterium]